jgi:hypothetical protein
MFKQVQQYIFNQLVPYIARQQISMCHEYVLHSMDICSSNFDSMITSQFFYFVNQYLPYPFSIQLKLLLSFSSLHLFCCEVSHILKHSNCSKVVVDVLSIICNKSIDCMKYCYEVLLTETVNVITDY